MSDDILPDEELRQRAMGGDDVAVRQLLLPHLARLSRVMADKYPQLQRGMSSVDDIIQETFAEAYRRLAEFDPRKGSLRTWLSTIADRRAMHALRDAQRIKRGGRHRRIGQVVGEASSLHDIVEMLSAGSHTASRSAMRHEAVQAIEDTIAELPPAYQQAVQLHLIDGKTLEETAEIMCRTAHSVRGLIDRAKKKMRAALGRLSRYQ